MGAVTINAPSGGTTIASATSIDLSSVTTRDNTVNSGDSTTLTGLVTANFGGFPMTVIDNDNLVTLGLGQTVNPLADGIAITAPVATAIDINSLATSLGLITIVSAASTAVIHLDALTKATVGISADTVPVDQFHLPALTEISGVRVDINAKIIDLSSLVKVLTPAAVIFTNTENLITTDTFVSATAALTFTTCDIAHINLPKLVLGAVLTANSSTTQLTVASTGDATFANANVAGNTALKTLNITAATVNIAPVPADVINLDYLNVAGKIGATALTQIDIDLTAAPLPALQSLTLSNFNAATVTAATLLVTLTTTGAINDLTIDANPALKDLLIGHGPHSYPNFPAQAVTITGNVGTGFKSVDLGSVVLLDAATITGNTSLAVITAPDVTGTLLTNAVVDLTINSNSLIGTGTTEVPGTFFAAVEQPSLTTWKAYILHVQATIGTTDALVDAGAGPLSFDLDYDANGLGVDGGTGVDDFVSVYGGTPADGNVGGSIDLIVELDYIDKVQPTP